MKVVFFKDVVSQLVRLTTHIYTKHATHHRCDDKANVVDELLHSKHALQPKKLKCEHKGRKDESSDSPDE